MSTTTETEEMALTFTQAAAEKLLELMDEKGVRETHALRVFVSGVGCGGLQYGMAFDNNLHETDTVFEQHGMRVVIDPQSLLWMAGSSIDYVEDPAGSGFHIENPNVMLGCGGGCSSCR